MIPGLLIKAGIIINTFTLTLLLEIIHCARSPKSIFCNWRLIRMYPGIFENGIFFSNALADSHINGIFGHQTLLKRFQKRSPDYMWTDDNGGFRKRCCHYHTLLALRMLCKGCKSYFFQFSVFVWTGKTIRISYLWMCYYYDYFENREKCLPFEKIPGYVCTGQRNSYWRTFH